VFAGRFGRGAGLGAGLGFAAALGSFLPLWGWAAYQLHERDRFDPGLPGFEVQRAVVTDDGLTAFALAWNQNGRWDWESLPLHALRIDLERGTYERLGDGDLVLLRWNAATPECGDADNVHLYDRSGGSLDLAFYLATGAPVGSKDQTLMISRCPERRGWMTSYPPVRPESTLVDGDGTVVHLADLALPPRAIVWSDLGRWFVTSPQDGAWRLDPRSGELARAPWLDAVGTDFGPRLPDGRFFAPLREGGVALVDPEQELVTKVSSGDPVKRVYRAYGTGNLPFEVHEVVLLRTSEDVYRFDATSGSLQPVPFLRRNIPIGSAPDGSVWALAATGLVRVDPVSGAWEPVFPAAR